MAPNNEKLPLTDSIYRHSIDKMKQRAYNLACVDEKEPRKKVRTQ